MGTQPPSRDHPTIEAGAEQAMPLLPVNVRALNTDVRSFLVGWGTYEPNNRNH